MFYRLRTSLAHRYLRFRIRTLDDTPTLASDPRLRCEVHTMLGTRDVAMYILAVKSLLTLVPFLSVVVHSDGSLTERDFSRVAHHIDGVRFVRHREADERAEHVLRGSPFLRQWRAVDAAYRRLIDIELWRRAERIIILDADVLTCRTPHEVIDWIRTGEHPFLLGQPPLDDASQPGRRSEHVQALFLRRIDEIGARLGVRGVFVQGGTAGFCGYTRELSLDRIETALKAAVDLGLPMSQWGGDQCLIVFLLSVHGGDRLPSDRYLNFEPSVRDQAQRASVIHFYGTHRFHRLVYPNLAAATVARLHDTNRALA
jgi:hypothetical protein